MSISGGAVSVPHLIERLFAAAGHAQPRRGADGGRQISRLLRGQNDDQDGAA